MINIDKRARDSKKFKAFLIAETLLGGISITSLALDSHAIVQGIGIGCTGAVALTYIGGVVALEKVVAAVASKIPKVVTP